MFAVTNHFKSRFLERFNIEFTDGIAVKLLQSIANNKSKCIQKRKYPDNKLHLVFYNNTVLNYPIIFSISKDKTFITCIDPTTKDEGY